MAYAGICGAGRPPAAHRPLLLLPQRRRDQRDDGSRADGNVEEQTVVNLSRLRRRATRSPSSLGGRRADPIATAPPTPRPASTQRSPRSPASPCRSPQVGLRRVRLLTDTRRPSARRRPASRSIFNDGPTVQADGQTSIDPHGHQRRRRSPASSARPSQGGPTTNQGIAAGRPRNHSTRRSPRPADKTIPIRTPFTLTGSGDRRRRRHARPTCGSRPTPAAAPAPAWSTTPRSTVRCSACSARRPPVSDDGHAAVPLAGREPRRRHPTPDLPGPGPGARRQHQRRDRHLPGAAGADHAAAATTRSLDCFSEFLPDRRLRRQPGARRRVMHFRLTARDQRPPTGGGLSSDDVTLTVDPTAGPVPGHLAGNAAAPASGAGPPSPVTWAVTNTARAGAEREDQPVDRRRATFPTVLAAVHAQRRVRDADPAQRHDQPPRGSRSRRSATTSSTSTTRRSAWWPPPRPTRRSRPDRPTTRSCSTKRQRFDLRLDRRAGHLRVPRRRRARSRARRTGSQAPLPVGHARVQRGGGQRGRGRRPDPGDAHLHGAA